MSIALDRLTTLAESTSDNWSKDTKRRVNETVPVSMIWGRYINGRDARYRTIRGGMSIRERIVLSDSPRFEWINPGHRTQTTNLQSGVNIQIPWAFGRTYWMAHDQELMLNEDQNSEGYQKQVLKDVLSQKKQDMYTDAAKVMDHSIAGQVPWQERMEAASVADEEARRPYCLHALVNEYNTGAVPYAIPGTTIPPALLGGLGGAGLIPAAVDFGGTAWTTVETINPTTAGQEMWRNYQDTYGTWQNLPADSAIEQDARMDALWDAFHRSMLRTNIHEMPKWPEYAEPERTPTCIYTSATGMQYAAKSQRRNPWAFYSMNTSEEGSKFRAPSVMGVTLVHSSQLDLIPLYLNGDADAGVTETDETAHHAGPRYIGCNGQYLLPFVQQGKFLELGKVRVPDGMDETRVQYANIWGNFGTISRRSHFHIRPDGAAAVAA